MDGQEGQWFPLANSKKGEILLMADFVDANGNDSRGNPSALANTLPVWEAREVPATFWVIGRVLIASHNMAEKDPAKVQNWMRSRMEQEDNLKAERIQNLLDKDEVGEANLQTASIQMDEGKPQLTLTVFMDYFLMAASLRVQQWCPL